MIKNKVAIVASQIIEKTQLIAGILIIFLFGFCTIGSFTDAELRSDGFLVFCIVMDVIGIVLILLSVKRKRLVVDFKKYVGAILEDPTGSIENLAATIGTSQDVVKKNLELMIRRKYFANTYINQETNCIVIKGASNSNTVQQTQNNAQSQQFVQPQTNAPKIESIPVTCKSCGGNNKIVKGTVGECDFCGSIMK